MIIGNFKKTDEGFRGVIKTLTIEREVLVSPIAEKKGEKSPDYRLTTGHTDIGAAWKETSQSSGNVYLSVRLEDPALPSTVFCALVKTGTELGYTLVWSRNRKRNTPAAAPAAGAEF